MLNEISSGYYWTLSKGKFQYTALFPTSASRQLISHALLKIVFPSSFENLHWAWAPCVDFRLWLPKQKTITIFGNIFFSHLCSVNTNEKMHSKHNLPNVPSCLLMKLLQIAVFSLQNFCYMSAITPADFSISRTQDVQSSFFLFLRHPWTHHYLQEWNVSLYFLYLTMTINGSAWFPPVSPFAFLFNFIFSFRS